MTIKNTLETIQIYYKIRYYTETVEELVRCTLKGVLNRNLTLHLNRYGTKGAELSMTSRSVLLAGVNEIMREAASVGLDMAGSSLLGPVWPPFKRILHPIVKKLQRKYPKAFLLEGSSNPDRAEVKRAVDAFSSDRRLQEQLFRAFEKPGEGHEEILSRVASIQERLEKRFDQLEEMLRGEVLEALKGAPGDELQAIDINSEIDEYIRALDPSLYQKLQDSPGTRKVVVAAIALGRFKFRVLEEGRIHNTYRIKTLGDTYLFTPLRRFKDSYQQDCCDYATITLRKGQRESGRMRACRQADGTWKDMTKS